MSDDAKDSSGTSGDSSLDSAWRLLTLRLEERGEPDFDYDDYLRDNYSVDFESLYKFYEAICEGGIQEEELCGMFVIAFEFGKLHERYVKDMEFLS